MIERPVSQRQVPKPEHLAAFERVDELLARVFAARGVRDPAELDYGLSMLAPVSKLENVEAAVELLISKRDERIVIVGDFDVDGATSTALFIRCLQAFGFADVDYVVPNRFEYGYGLSPEIVEVAARSSPALLVTVDNGISSIDGVTSARERGIPVIVTDHHLPGQVLPPADVIVNPNLEGSEFPSRHLAGVGVAFYVLAMLGRRLEAQGMSGAARVPAKFLDLVALGTVADVVRLDHNNRVLVEQGLKRIRAGQCVAGITALLNQAGRDCSRCVSTDLGFAAGPRLNAAGRLEDISVGIECLLTDEPATAAGHAATLDAINRERREIETVMREQAYAYVEKMDVGRVPPCICVYDEDWHQGVVGLIASRVKDRWHRPVIAFAREGEGRLKGSARSISGVHIRDLLEHIDSTNPGLIRKFGGHAMAAGLTIAESDFAAFRKLAPVQLAALYPDADLSGTILVDGMLPADAHSVGFARTLRNAGPWGAGFPEPVWTGDFTIIEQRTVGEQHLKMRVRALAGGPPVDAIAFNQADVPVRDRARLVYKLDVNAWRGVESAQLVVEQIAVL